MRRQLRFQPELFSRMHSWTGTALFVSAVFVIFATHACADELLHRYECNKLPSDLSTGWMASDPNTCQDFCTPSIQNGHFRLFWPAPGGEGRYYHQLAPSADEAPQTLWIEWSFRSNHPLGPTFFGCDGRFKFEYKSIGNVVNTYGDAVISAGADYFVLGLSLEEFHTYRFESLDGANFSVSVDGEKFWPGFGFANTGVQFIQITGDGGCRGDSVPNMYNEWDFVRYGTISFGEQIVSSNPPQGFLDARKHVGLQRFTITYDSPNYVYIDDITVETTATVTPQVIATRRLDNGEPDTVEIVLNQPIPLNATTRFTFNDGVAVNTIEYAFAPADTDGDGKVSLSDFAAFQRCFDQIDPTRECLVVDMDRNNDVDLLDYREFQSLLQGP